MAFMQTWVHRGNWSWLGRGQALLSRVCVCVCAWSVQFGSPAVLWFWVRASGLGELQILVNSAVWVFFYSFCLSLSDFCRVKNWKCISGAAVCWFLSTSAEKHVVWMEYVNRRLFIYCHRWQRKSSKSLCLRVWNMQMLKIFCLENDWNSKILIF